MTTWMGESFVQMLVSKQLDEEDLKTIRELLGGDPIKTILAGSYESMNAASKSIYTEQQTRRQAAQEAALKLFQRNLAANGVKFFHKEQIAGSIGAVCRGDLRYGDVVRIGDKAKVSPVKWRGRTGYIARTPPGGRWSAVRIPVYVAKTDTEPSQYVMVAPSDLTVLVQAKPYTDFLK